MSLDGTNFVFIYYTDQLSSNSDSDEVVKNRKDDTWKKRVKARDMIKTLIVLSSILFSVGIIMYGGILLNKDFNTFFSFVGFVVSLGTFIGGMVKYNKNKNIGKVTTNAVTTNAVTTNAVTTNAVTTTT